MQIVDDLASLGVGAGPGAPVEGAAGATAAGATAPPPERWQWLRPWAWISGLGWRSRRREADVALDVHVRGAGLENATAVRVRAMSRTTGLMQGQGWHLGRVYSGSDSAPEHVSWPRNASSAQGSPAA